MREALQFEKMTMASFRFFIIFCFISSYFWIFVDFCLNWRSFVVLMFLKILQALLELVFLLCPFWVLTSAQAMRLICQDIFYIIDDEGLVAFLFGIFSIIGYLQALQKFWLGEFDLRRILMQCHHFIRGLKSVNVVPCNLGAVRTALHPNNVRVWLFNLI